MPSLKRDRLIAIVFTLLIPCAVARAESLVLRSPAPSAAMQQDDVRIVTSPNGDTYVALTISDRIVLPNGSEIACPDAAQRCVYLIRRSASGRIAWTSLQPSASAATALVSLPQGGVALAVLESTAPGTIEGAALLRIDASGAVTSRLFLRETGEWIQLTSLVPRDDRVLFTGYAMESCPLPGVARAYSRGFIGEADDAGHVAWSVGIPAGNSIASALVVLPDGDLAVTGSYQQRFRGAGVALPDASRMSGWLGRFEPRSRRFRWAVPLDGAGAFVGDVAGTLVVARRTWPFAVRGVDPQTGATRFDARTPDEEGMIVPVAGRLLAYSSRRIVSAYAQQLLVREVTAAGLSAPAPALRFEQLVPAEFPALAADARGTLHAAVWGASRRYDRSGSFFVIGAAEARSTDALDAAAADSAPLGALCAAPMDRPSWDDTRRLGSRAREAVEACLPAPLMRNVDLLSFAVRIAESGAIEDVSAGSVSSGAPLGGYSMVPDDALSCIRRVLTAEHVCPIAAETWQSLTVS